MSDCRDHIERRGLERSIPKLDRTARDAHERLADRLCISALHSDADATTALPLVAMEKAMEPLPARHTRADTE